MTIYDLDGFARGLDLARLYHQPPSADTDLANANAKNRGTLTKEQLLFEVKQVKIQLSIDTACANQMIQTDIVGLRHLCSLLRPSFNTNTRRDFHDYLPLINEVHETTYGEDAYYRLLPNCVNRLYLKTSLFWFFDKRYPIRLKRTDELPKDAPYRLLVRKLRELDSI